MSSVRSTRTPWVPLGHLEAIPLADSAWWTVMYAFARSKPYGIDVVAGFDGANSLIRSLHREQQRSLPKSAFMRIRVVWAGAFDDEELARSCAEWLRALPHSWRRHWVEQRNPSWRDVLPRFSGFPFDSGRVEE